MCEFGGHIENHSKDRKQNKETAQEFKEAGAEDLQETQGAPVYACGGQLGEGAHGH